MMVDLPLQISWRICDDDDNNMKEMMMGYKFTCTTGWQRSLWGNHPLLLLARSLIMIIIVVSDHDGVGDHDDAGDHDEDADHDDDADHDLGGDHDDDADD